MEQQVVTYIKKHTTLVTILILFAVVLLASGEYYLYRQQMYLNKMMSEGFMQLKESQSQIQSQLLERENPVLMEKTGK